MDRVYALKDYYVRYLEDVRHVSKSTVNHYLDAINWISKYLKKKHLISDLLYEVLDLSVLENLNKVLLSDLDFVAMNKRGHQMYTAGLNNYLRFARGEDFSKTGKTLSILDKPIQVPDIVIIDKEKRWKRSGIIKEQSLRSADYICEVSSDHFTFIMKNANHAYMEGHHSIPMQIQERFDTSLDIYANIVCLCPTCHRLMHYGRDSDKKPVLDKIYYERSSRLARSGIQLSHEEFINIAL